MVDLASFIRGVHRGPADPPTLLRAEDGDKLAPNVAMSWVSRPTGRPPSFATKLGRTEALIRTPLRATVCRSRCFCKASAAEGDRNIFCLRIEIRKP